MGHCHGAHGGNAMGHTVALPWGTQWHRNVALPCGTLWHTVAHGGTAMGHTVAMPCGNATWHTVAHCGTQWHWAGCLLWAGMPSVLPGSAGAFPASCIMCDLECRKSEEASDLVLCVTAQVPFGLLQTSGTIKNPPHVEAPVLSSWK